MDNTSYFRVVETVITIDGKTVFTYGITNDRINIFDICLEKSKVSEFCELLNSTESSDDKEILYSIIDDYFAFV